MDGNDPADLSHRVSGTLGGREGCEACLARVGPRGATLGLYAVHDRIEINAKIMLGKPVIRGTRIPVELIARKLAKGADEKMVRQAYPKLTPEDIRAALRYAADALRLART
jgi:uncharacterized protein (DUF433 family)